MPKSGFLSRLYDWLHPYQAIIKIVDQRLAVHDEAVRSYWRGVELDRLVLTSGQPGVTTEPLVEGREVIVSLTTHGKRLYEVARAIESVMQGTCLPNRIVLWLSDELRSTPLPLNLVRQQKRGLQIEYVPDLGPHTKLIPAMRRFPDGVIVTIDDDMYYQYDMLEHLIAAYRREPSAIHACRVAVMTFDARQRLKGYLQWEHYTHPEHDSPRNVIMGVEGCLYPPHSLADEVMNEAALRELCPYADDIWFTAMALLRGTPIRHLQTHYGRGGAGGIENAGVQDIGLVLSNDNKDDCRNDRQIAAVFARYDLVPLILGQRPASHVSPA